MNDSNKLFLSLI